MVVGIYETKAVNCSEMLLLHLVICSGNALGTQRRFRKCIFVGDESCECAQDLFSSIGTTIGKRKKKIPTCTIEMIGVAIKLSRRHSFSDSHDHTTILITESELN